MPYTLDNLPETIVTLEPKKRRQWRDIFNSAFARLRKAGKSEKDAESGAFAQANGVVLSDKAEHATFGEEDRAVGNLAAFALPTDTPPIVADDIVYRSGLIFRAGDYPDKAFSMTAAELAAAAEAFSAPVPIDLGHGTKMPHPLEDRLGEVVSLQAEGEELHGTVALPKWLDDALGDAERKVSATWDRSTKQLAGLALVTHPRVPDAALMGAYAAFASRHDTWQGQRVIQDLHDTAARGGAVCKKPKAEMASRHEADVLQTTHDLAVEHGARCDAIERRAIPMFSNPAGGSGATPPQKGRTAMGKWEQLKALINGIDEGDDGEATSPPAQMSAPRPKADDASARELEEMKERNRAVEAENRRLRQERIQERAAAFAEKYIAAAKAFPAERDSIIAKYVQDATDDNTMGVVTFAEGQTTTRVALLEKAFDARPGHQLTTESLDPQVRKMFAIQDPATTPTGDKAEMSEERRKQLLGYSDIGKQVLAEKANGTSRHN